MSTRPLTEDPRWTRARSWLEEAGTGHGRAHDIAVLGVPTWRTSLSPTGAATTPVAIREALGRFSTWVAPDRASTLAQSPSAGSVGLDVRQLNVVDFGDVTEPDGPEGEARAIAAVAAAAAQARLLIALGGDNAATFSTALGVWGDALSTAGLVTLDAHHDVRDGISNGSPVRRLIEQGLAGHRVVQVGIADFANSAEYAARAADFGIVVIHRDELHRRPIDDLMVEAVEIAASAGGPVHLDIDVDVCDRASAPACPASTPGGISADELRRAVRAAVNQPAVKSIDVTEVDASADAPDQRTVRLAALCVLEAAAGLAGRA